MKIACLAAFVSVRGALLLTALTSFADAQNQTWIRQFGTTIGEVAYASAPDGSGGVYVSGVTDGSLGGPNAGGSDVWLAHYDGAGNRSWIRQFGTSGVESSYAAAPDGAGGVYVSGRTSGSLAGPHAGSYDAWIARYDGAGNQTWIRQFGTPIFDGGTAAAPDGAGGVFVSGYTYGSLVGTNAGAQDVWIAHYDGAGNQTWIRQFGSTDWDYARAAAPDGAGGVYVCGYTEGSLGGPTAGILDAWLAHYDGAGNQTWIRQFGTNYTHFAVAAAPDGAGGVFVSGFTTGSLGGPSAGYFDAWIARYDAAGNQTWIRQFGTIDGDFAYAAAPDGAGGVFVSGDTTGSLGGPNAGSEDAWLAHYDGAGNRSWIRQFATNDDDRAYAAAPDGAGGVFVSGHTEGSLGGPNAGFEDAWLAHYDDLRVTGYCSPAISNSTGLPGELTATGSSTVVLNHVTVEASQLPTNSFGFLLTSRHQGSTYPINASQGRLCLGGFIGRYVGPEQIQNSGSTGTFSLAVDLTAVPTPFGPVVVRPGDNWNFQAWYRDAIFGAATSNFTDAVSVTFL